MVWNLSPGAGVAVVAPAGPVEPELFAAGLAVLATRYQVVRGYEPGRRRAAPLAYLAADDGERARAINEALQDSAVGAIFCARGGYGAMRLLERLDSASLARRRIPLVGFSDCTALHAWAAGLGVPSVHGPVVTQLATLPPDDVQALFALLEGKLPRLTGLQQLVRGQASGPLRGGNLQLLAHLCGTPYLPELRGCILLLEEVSEAPYRLDRLLTHLRLCGVFERVAGIVVGTLQGCDAAQGQPPVPVAALEVVGERLGGLNIPVVTGAPVGHGARNLALPLGLDATLDADAGVLSFSGS